MKSFFRAVLVGMALLALVVPCAQAQGIDANGQRVRSLDDPLVTDVENILIESGSLFLSNTAPFSDRDLRSALDRINPDRLSDEGRIMYDAALDALKPDPVFNSSIISVKARIRVDLDANWRSNESIPWVLGYQERPPFLALPLEAWVGKGFYGYFEPSLRRDYYSVTLPVSQLSVPNYTSIPIDFLGADGNFPFRSFGAAGGDFWNFRIGRDRISIGSMGENNLVVSSKTEWYDYARAALFFRNFQYSVYMIQLQPERNLYLHRVDFLVVDRLSVGLTESILVGYAAPELRYLSPFMIYHGFEAWNDENVPATATTGGTTPAPGTSGVGSMFGVEFNYNPVRFMTLTAQYQFNAGRDPLKMLLWPNSTAEIPNSAAYLLGARLRIPWQGGYLKGDLCGVYSEPFDMILANDHISYIYHRPSNSSYSGDPVQEWIGFSEGPDCILGSASIGYQTASHAVATLSASYRWKGMNDLSTVYAKTTANAALRTPTGIVEGRLRVGANFSLPFGERWKASAAAYYTSRVNAQNHLGTADQSVELMGGIGLSLP